MGGLLLPAVILSPREMTFGFNRLSLRRRGRIIKTLRSLADDATTDESLHRAQFVPILRCDKADGVAHRTRPAGCGRLPTKVTGKILLQPPGDARLV